MNASVGSLNPLFLLLSSTMIWSCQTTGSPDRAAETGLQMAEVRAAAVVTKDRITALNASLTYLQHAPDTKAAFDQFVATSKKLEDATDDSQTARTNLRAHGVDYFAEWERSNSTILDSGMKQTAQARRNQMQERFSEVDLAIDEAIASYRPYLARIKDVRTVMANDLSTAGLQSVDSPVETVMKEGNDVARRLDKVIKTVDETWPSFPAATGPAR
jgi:hypothetical protein